jgi:hypothetical protein
MQVYLTMVPELGDVSSGCPGWNEGRRIDLHWLADDQHPYVVAAVVVTRVELCRDGVRRLHLAVADPGEC